MARGSGHTYIELGDSPGFIRVFGSLGRTYVTRLNDVLRLPAQGYSKPDRVS